VPDQTLPATVLEYALELHDVLPAPLMNLIHHQVYKNNEASFQKGTTGTTTAIQDDRIRSVKVLGLAEESIGTSVSLRVLYNKLHRINNFIVKSYIDNVSTFLMPPNQVVFQFLKYTDKMKGHYEAHTDNSFTNPRNTTVIISLSDPSEYEGGELQIQNSEKLLKLKKGSGVIFPSNFMFPHKVYPVTKGERRVLVIWNT